MNVTLMNEVAPPSTVENPTSRTDVYSLDAARQIVEECYLGILGRAADPHGRDLFVSGLTEGCFDVSDMCRDLLASDEMKLKLRKSRLDEDVEDDVRLVALALPLVLGRHLSEADIELHQDLLRQGNSSFTQLLNTIILGPEVQARSQMASFNSNDVLRACYRSIYNREVDAAALAFFGEKLIAGELTLDDLMTMMLSNSEAQISREAPRSTFEIDRDALENAVLARLWVLGFRFQIGPLEHTETPSATTSEELDAFTTCFDISERASAASSF